MTCTIRTFYFSGVVTAKTTGRQLHTDSVGLIKHPYLSRDSVTVDSSAAQSISQAPSGSGLLVVQVQAGKAAHVEINPPGRNIPADTGSYIVSGEQSFNIGEGWSASFLEHEVA